jgi:hypothetical protein
MQYSSDNCGGNGTATQVQPVNTCFNQTKIMCGDGLNIPGSNTYKLTYYHNANGACSGTQYHNFAVWDACIPNSQKITSTKYHLFNNQSVQQISYNSSRDCTGYSKSDFSLKNTVSLYYSSSSQDLNNYLTWSYYMDKTNCTGDSYRGNACQSGICLNGRICECVNGEFHYWIYDYEDCSGNRTIILNLTAGQCSNGVKATCSGTYTVPSKTQVSEVYTAGSCASSSRGALTYIVTETCFTESGSGSYYTYDSTHNQMVHKTYQYTNCTGANSTDLRDIFTISFGAAASLTVNKVLVAFIVGLTFFALF